MPMGTRYRHNLFQFVHVDDVARLIAWLLSKAPAEEGETLTLNVAGSGSPISIAQCAEIAGTPIVQLPTKWLCRKMMSLLWKFRVSAVSPEAFPYMTGSYTMSTQRLRDLLGSDYGKVIQYSTEAALRETVKEESPRETTQVE
jgi:nucleoside-diphosphate-sugar epimerase